MKKLFFTLAFLVISMFSCMYAQTYRYTTTDFAYRYVSNSGRWTDWSDWQDSRMLVVLSLDRNVLTIYSEEMQEYDIYDWGETQESSDGSSTLEMRGVNRDGLRCGIRIRVQRDGQKQLYIDFNDMMWVYNFDFRS